MNPFSVNKLLRYPEMITQWLRTGKTTGPLVVDLDLTNACPHNCPRCPGEWRSNPAAKLSQSEVIDYVYQFRDIGTKAISLGGGGDPMAHPDAVGIIEYIGNMGLSVGVITNGAIMSNMDAECLAEHASWVRVSLDAATPEVFAITHGVAQSQFEKVIGNIRLLAGIPGRKAIVGVGVLTDSATSDQIIPAAELVKSLGADYIQYRPYNHDRTDVTEIIRQAANDYGGSKFSVCASWAKYELMKTVWQKSYRVCRMHHFGTVVTAEAHMHFCCDLRDSDGYVGNLRESSVRELWRSAKREQVACSIDLMKCPPFCRGNAINLLLDSFASPITHEEFL